jgi:hypothetical protein
MLKPGGTLVPLTVIAARRVSPGRRWTDLGTLSFVTLASPGAGVGVGVHCGQGEAVAVAVGQGSPEQQGTPPQFGVGLHGSPIVVPSMVQSEHQK